MPVETFLTELAKHPPVRTPGTAVFMDSNPTGVPITLVHNTKYNRVLHERVILLTVVTEEVPRVSRANRLEIQELAPDFFGTLASFGFMETPKVPAILRLAAKQGLAYNPKEVTFFLGRETLVLRHSRGMPYWRKQLFAILSRNAQSAIAHFGIPPNRTIEIGAQLTL